jgi:hypothetical protein
VSRALRIAGGIALVTLVFAGLASAQTQTAITVQSLLDQDFQVVGTIPSNAGPGLFMQKKDKLFFCVVAETPTSLDVATRYCKPVR